MAKLVGSGRPNTPQQQTQQQLPVTSHASEDNKVTKSEHNTPTISPPPDRNAVELENFGKQSTPIATTTNNNNNTTPVFPSRPTQSKKEHMSQWILRELEHIFKITLDSNEKSNTLVYLPNLAHELQDSNDKLDENYLDSVFMEILSEIGVPGKRPISYLYSVYHAAYKVKRSLPIKAAYHDEKVSLLNQIINLSVRYGNMGLQMPDMFLSSNIEQALNTIVERFADMSSFLVDIVKVSHEEGTLLDFLNLVFPYMSLTLTMY